ncbi:hypothetical protein R1flu_019441 [Riccia fluitans]|uniref:Protein kinase domain-containing protein n=1 Tax=Riccia fluitans TaxID=41844 RepID=A0ABD1ZIN8_9MARC
MSLDMKTFRQALAKTAAVIEKTVQSTVQEVTGPKPLQDYELLEQVGSGGPGLIWKLYAGRPRNKAMQIHNPEVCVWVLDKKSLIDLRLRAGISKAAEDAFLDIVRADAAQLMRLRHPGVVRVIQGLDESKGAMAMVTEPIFASLANALGRLDNVTNSPKELQNLELGQLEIKHGLLQVAETLGFLHNNAHLIHRAISPEAVYITSSGAWKLAGFGFAISSEQSSSDSHDLAFHYPDYDVEENVMPLQPLLEYAAPELTRQGSAPRPSTDVFGLACVAFHLLTQRSLLQCNNNLRTYTSTLTYLSSENLEGIPSDLLTDLRRMLNPDELSRPSAMDFTSSPYFRNDTRLRALRFLDHMLERDNMQKSDFLKALGEMWTGFDARVLRYKVLVPLCAELRNEVMQPMVLPMVLTIAESQDKSDFMASTLPSLLPVLNTAHGDTLLLLVKHAALLINKVGPEVLASSVLPMLVRAYDDPDARMQEEVLRRTLAVTKQLDFPMLKETILPRVHGLALKTTVAAVRVNALLCLGELVQRLDKIAVADVLQTLKRCTAVDHSAPTLMCTLGVASAIYKQFGIEYSAEHLLPLLCPLLVAQQLNLHQFAKYMHFVKEILRKIEEKRGLTVVEAEPVTLDVSSMALGAEKGSSEDLRTKVNGTQSKKSSAWDAEDWESVIKVKKSASTPDISSSDNTAPSLPPSSHSMLKTSDSAAAFPPVSLSTAMVPEVPLSNSSSYLSEPAPFEWPPRQNAVTVLGSKPLSESIPSSANNNVNAAVAASDDFDPFADWPPRPASIKFQGVSAEVSSSRGEPMKTTWSSSTSGPPDMNSNRGEPMKISWSGSTGGPPIRGIPPKMMPSNLNDWSSSTVQNSAVQQSQPDFGNFFSGQPQSKPDVAPKKLAPPPPSGLGKGRGRNPIRGIGSPRSKSSSSKDPPNLLDLL